MPKLFESGNEADGYPGLQQAVQNMVRDNDGNRFSIVKAPTITWHVDINMHNTACYYFRAGGFNVLEAGEFELINTHFCYLTTGGVLTGWATTGWEGMLLGYRDGETFKILQNSRELSGGQYLEINTERQRFVSPIILADVTGTTMNYTTGIVIELSGTRFLSTTGTFTELTGTRMLSYTGYIQEITGVRAMFTSGNIEELDVERFTVGKIVNGNNAILTGLAKIDTNDYTGNYINITSKGYFNQLTGLDVNFTAITGINAVFTNSSLGTLSNNVAANGKSITEMNMMSGITAKATLLSGVNITGQYAYFSNFQAPILNGDIYGSYKNITNLYSVAALTGVFNTGVMYTGAIGYVTGVNFLTGNYGHFIYNLAATTGTFISGSVGYLTGVNFLTGNNAYIINKITSATGLFNTGLIGYVTGVNYITGNNAYFTNLQIGTTFTCSDSRLSDTRVPKCGHMQYINEYTTDQNFTNDSGYPRAYTVYVYSNTTLHAIAVDLYVSGSTYGEYLVGGIGAYYSAVFWSNKNSATFIIANGCRLRVDVRICDSACAYQIYYTQLS